MSISKISADETGQTNITSKPTEVYFSPDGGIRDKIISRINLSKNSIKIAIYDLTSGDIAGALLDAVKHGVDVKIVADLGQSNGKHSEIGYLRSQGMNVELISGLGRGIMHDKFAIFDGKEVFTGSYNWTNNAEYYNRENAIFISDPEVVGKYQMQFDRLYK